MRTIFCIFQRKFGACKLGVGWQSSSLLSDYYQHVTFWIDIFSPYVFGSVVNVVWFGKVEMGRFRYRQPSPSIAPVDQKSYILSCGSTSFIGATVPCLVITLFYFRMYYVLCIKARSNVHAVTSFLFGTFSLIYGVDLYRDFVW